MYRNFVKFNSSTDHHFDGFWAPYDNFFDHTGCFRFQEGPRDAKIHGLGKNPKICESEISDLNMPFL